MHQMYLSHPSYKSEQNLTTPLTYENLESRIAAWAATQPDIRAVLLIGSRARETADRWSDLDTIILTTDAERYAADDGWLREFGQVWLTAREKTDPGHDEWYALYEGDDGDALKLDAVLIPVDDPALDLDALLAIFPYQGVLSRGCRVLYDSADEPRTIAAKPFTPPAPPTREAYNHLVGSFLIDTLTGAKFVERGDLWRSQRWLAEFLRPCVLKMIEWHAHGKNTWYAGRYMAEWADSRVIAALPTIFADHEAEHMKAALLAMLDLFRWLGEEVGARFGYSYPAVAHDKVAVLVREILGE